MKKISHVINWGLALIFISFIGAMIWAKEFRNWFFKTFDESLWPGILVCVVLIALFGIQLYIFNRRKKRLKKS